MRHYRRLFCPFELLLTAPTHAHALKAMGAKIDDKDMVACF